jgi:hypothetical protein
MEMGVFLFLILIVACPHLFRDLRNSESVFL